MALEIDKKFMEIALSEARLGIPFAAPNPIVGCVIVKNGAIIAKGAHKKYGSQHAELEAFSAYLSANLGSDSSELNGATLYVNLEPCSHHGKTPPCVESIIKAGIKRVVIAMRDPNVLVNGQGVKVLRDAGIEVEIGVLGQEANDLNEKYKKWIKARIPFVLVKSAITLDGSMSLEPGMKSSLSGEESNAMVHELRNEYDAIAVGVETCLIDDPLLTCRSESSGRNPLRVIFDTHLRIPRNLRMFKESGKTLVFTGPSIDEGKKKDLESNFGDVKVVQLSLDEYSNVHLASALEYLGQNGISSLMVEGGPRLIASFFNDTLVDKISLIYTPQIATDLVAANKFFSEHIKNKLHFKKVNWEMVGNDAWLTAYPTS